MHRIRLRLACLLQSSGPIRLPRQCTGCSRALISGQRFYTAKTIRNPGQATLPSANRRKLYLSLLGLSLLPGLYFVLPYPFRSFAHPQHLSPQKYTRQSVLSIEPVSSRHVLLQIQINEASRALFTTLRQDQEGQVDIQHICVKSPDLQIERPYTPINDVAKDGVIKIIVKRVRGGEVGRHIHNLKAGDDIEIRGPILTAVVPTASYDHLTLVSTGTGIAPFLQLLSKINPASSNSDSTERPASLPSISLLHYQPLSMSSSIPSDQQTETLTEDLLKSRLVLSCLPNLQPFVDDATAPSLLNGDFKIRRLSAEHQLSVKDISQSFAPDDHENDGYAKAAGRSWKEWLAGAAKINEQPAKDARRNAVMLCLPIKSLSPLVGPPPRGRSVPPLGGVLAHAGMDRRDVWIL